MKILLVAATRAEIEPFLTHFSFSDVPPFEKTIRNYQIKVLLTGVGMVATAFALGKAFSEEYFDLAINAGIAGSFNPSIKPGDICLVKEDTFVELGAEDGDEFLSMEILGLGKSTYLSNPHPTFTNSRNLQEVKAITVNKVHGNEHSILKTIAHFNPEIESMEGAAFFYGCEQAHTSCIQIRAISNFVERRNRANWNIELAVNRLNDTLIHLFDS
ncbi:futalosine hydrolase [Daejeonella sp.]|jgi:futalosine hydrolase|uniref:futalosine hydrolase n=1 Tax=Daejeonella sp. TaxID=2805397 RepID=UPI0037C077FD